MDLYEEQLNQTLEFNEIVKLMQFICQVHMLWSISIAYIGVILIKLVIFNKIL